MSNYKPLLAAGLASLSMGVVAQDDIKEASVVLDTYVTEDVVDDLGLMQLDPVDSVFGFDKSAAETPRSVSSVGAEFIEQYNISSINDVATFVPGAFTTSFFGVAGSLDIRGTAGDNYFRGVKRLTNDGTYPTAIGASNRIDVIRGPMSPISGPSRVGGAMNFVPKTARAETGAYLSKPTGSITYTGGSWDKNVLKGEVGGPLEIGDRKLGYYLYGEVEDSNSYYDNDFTEQTLVQASFNMDLNDTTRIEFGGMYQEWDGHENGGWNRVTQDLVDNGTYITGQPNFTPVDTNGDGLINDDEFAAGFITDGTGSNNCWGEGGPQAYCLNGGFGALDPSTLTAADIPAQYGITATGVVDLDGSNVLIDQSDFYKTDVVTLYFDIMHETDSGWNITNKFFYESVESEAQIGYGFAKAGDTWGIENQLIFAKKFEMDNVTSDIQISPSVRHVDAWSANDFLNEVFDRVDLTVGYNANSLTGLPTNSADNWGTSDYSEYTQYGLAFLADNQIGDSLNVLFGVRYDYVDMEASIDSEALVGFHGAPGAKDTDSDDSISYNVSVSYKFDNGLIPYFTYAEQSTILGGVHDAVQEAFVENGGWLGKSEMKELGVKGNFLDGRLYMAVAAFEQERVAVNSNSVGESNESLKTEGVEFEARWLVNDKLQLMANATQMEVTRLDLGGSMFTYIGASDVPQLDPTLIWGGIVGGDIQVPNDADRGGMPESMFSLSARYSFSDFLNGTLTYSYVDEVNPAPTDTLTLPEYDLVNASLMYENDKIRAGLHVNNLLNEEYFRANFPGLYGNLSILPERERSYTASFTYKF